MTTDFILSMDYTLKHRSVKSMKGWLVIAACIIGIVAFIGILVAVGS